MSRFARSLIVLVGALVLVVLKPRPNALRAPLSFSGALANYSAVFSNPRSKLRFPAWRDIRLECMPQAEPMPVCMARCRWRILIPRRIGR